MIGSKGQAGPLGEDLISLIIVIFAVAFLLATINHIFISHIERYMEFDLHRIGWTMADRFSTYWAYRDHLNISYTRILDIKRVCSGCNSLPGGNFNITVMDLRDNNVICSCGFPPPFKKKVTRLPVAIKFNNTETHPGILEVFIWK